MNKSNSHIWIILLAAVALTLTACSEGDNADNAQAQVEQAQVEQAQQQLAQAKANLAEAKEAQSKDEAAEQALADDDEPAQQESAPDPAPVTEPEPAPEPAPQEQVCADCGTISSIVAVQTQGGPPDYVGSILGGVAGAAIGSQIGSGSGTTIATIVGAVGGALAGHEVQQRMTGQNYYKVTVRMDAGGTQTINVPSASRISEGMRVRVNGNNIVLM